MTATPSPDNVYVGAGNVYFDRHVDGVPTGVFRHLGNVPSLTITNNTTEITLKSAMDGARGVYKKIQTGTEILFNATLNEFDKHNLAIALQGSVAAFTQAMDTLTDEDINLGDPLTLDVWYDLGAVNPDVTAVKQGATTLVADTDYEIDEGAGLIRILSSGAGLAAATTWTGEQPELTGNQMFGSSESRIVGSLRYISAINQASGPRYRIDVWKLSVRLDGDLQLISEDFGEFTLQGTVELDTTKVEGQRYFRMIELGSLVDSSS